ncbi:bifunctional protein folD [Streptomyces laurentii]|uniref:Bifunctional protein folD n=1 Tax=Streptomyces laurentii TaxID=39478 RepID=A0A160P843_STRLU|nr:bifunctional protein folD [Streptomyces laurentii]
MAEGGLLADLGAGGRVLRPGRGPGTAPAPTAEAYVTVSRRGRRGGCCSDIGVRSLRVDGPVESTQPQVGAVGVVRGVDGPGR